MAYPLPEGETADREGPVGRARLDDWFRGEANAHSATMHWKMALLLALYDRREPGAGILAILGE